MDAYKTEFAHLADLEQAVGKDLGISQWFSITQDQINQFATLTQDEQWIHIDAERSRRESPYGTTVAHGFMILSFASQIAYQTIAVGDVVMGVNYGLDRVRFMSPTPVNARVRGHVKLIGYEVKPPNGARYTMQITFEIEGKEKPACVAEFIGMAFTRP